MVIKKLLYNFAIEYFILIPVVEILYCYEVGCISLLMFQIKRAGGAEVKM